MTATSSTTAHLDQWSSLVAIGDSITEGLWDPAPGYAIAPGDAANPHGSDVPLLGWADRLAGHLSARRVAHGMEPVRYANLAVRGRLLAPIVREQVPAAIALRPGLVAMDGGGNDILRPGVDLEEVCRLFESAVRRLRRHDIDVLILLPYRVFAPVVSLVIGRVAYYTATLFSIAQRYDAYVADSWGLTSLLDSRLWAADRIHPLPEAHERLAQQALIGLGLQPDPAWSGDALYRPLPERAPIRRAERLRAEAEWASTFARPWVERRLRGTSSGDGRQPKSVALQVVPPAPPHPGTTFRHSAPGQALR